MKKFGLRCTVFFTAFTLVSIGSYGQTIASCADTLIADKDAGNFLIVSPQPCYSILFAHNVEIQIPGTFSSHELGIEQTGTVMISEMSVPVNCTFWLDPIQPTSSVGIGQMKIILYPNPASELLNIHIPAGSQFRIYSITGKEMFISEFSKGEFLQVSLRDWPRGMYLIRSGNSGETLLLN